MLNILIIGGASAIAHETAKFFAADGATFFLVGRTQEKLDVVATDLNARGAEQVETYILDMNDFEQHAAMFDAAKSALGQVDAVLIAHGTLGDQDASGNNVDVMMRELRTNFLSTAAFLTLIAPYFEGQRRGNITVVSSVAGDRGRGTNYVYGSAMAGKTAFVSGYRNRMAKAGVSVLTVKPGQVDTPMTADMPKSPLFADPSTVGRDIYNAMKSERGLIYTPFYWRGIMAIIRTIPEAIFKRLSL